MLPVKSFLIFSLFVKADNCEWKNVCQQKKVCSKEPQFEVRSPVGPLEHFFEHSADDKEWHKQQQDKIINKYILKWAKTLIKGLGRTFYLGLTPASCDAPQNNSK
jgi:hypothetical protein